MRESKKHLYAKVSVKVQHMYDRKKMNKKYNLVID